MEKIQQLVIYSVLTALVGMCQGNILTCPVFTREAMGCINRTDMLKHEFPAPPIDARQMLLFCGSQGPSDSIQCYRQLYENCDLPEDIREFLETSTNGLELGLQHFCEEGVYDVVDARDCINNAIEPLANCSRSALIEFDDLPPSDDFEEIMRWNYAPEQACP